MMGINSGSAISQSDTAESSDGRELGLQKAR